MSPALATRRPSLRVATRRSPLALAQSRAVGERLSALSGRDLELVDVTTRGDIDSAPLTQIGGVGVFVAAVRRAVVEGRADVAVHSLKDLPTTPDPRLRLAAVPPREDARDALISREHGTLAELPVGARVGTGSPRRRTQLVAIRPDLQIVEIRGNVDTRLARVRRRGQGADLDAVVLAVAGLARLGRRDDVTEALDPEQVTPAPGQGALAVEVLAEPTDDDPAGLEAALRTVDDDSTRACVTAERSLLATLEAGCSAPVGALARVGDEPGTLLLQAVLARADGSLVRLTATGTIAGAAELGRRLAHDLLVTGELGSGAQRVPPADLPTVTDTYHAHRGSSE